MGTQVVSPRKLARLRRELQLDIVAAYASGTGKTLYLRSGRVLYRANNGEALFGATLWHLCPVERRAVEFYLEAYLEKASAPIRQTLGDAVQAEKAARLRGQATCIACDQPTEKTYTLERFDHETEEARRLVGIPFCALCSANLDLVERVTVSLFAKHIGTKVSSPLDTACMEPVE